LQAEGHIQGYSAQIDVSKLGQTFLRRSRNKQVQIAELCAWRETNVSTDFPAADGKARLLGRLSSKKFDVTGRDVA
jgi:hypothetical protein